MIDTGLVGRTIVVAGAGGGGIGTAICRALAEQGCTVAGLDLDPDKLMMSADAVRAAGASWVEQIVDLTAPTATTAAVDAVVRETGRVDGLVTVAGGLPRAAWARLEDHEPDAFDRVMALNLGAAVNSTVAVGRRLVAAGAGGGAIVHLASIAGLGAMPWGVAYSAAKAGLIAMTRTAAVEWGRHGIRVNAVAAGSIRTPTRPSAADQRSDSRPDSSVLPLGRRGRPDDIASAVVFLLSSQASWITGQVLAVDGGSSVLPSYLDDDLLPVFIRDDSFRQRLLGGPTDASVGE